MMLVPGLLRVPLPQADFHNIRHHDGAGEICPLHDHLLRWHPTASQNDDVATVHWHWIIPPAGDSGDGSASGNGDRDGFPSPLLHAYHLDCFEPDWSGDPVIGPDQRGRLSHDISPGHATPELAYNGHVGAPAGCRICAGSEIAHIALGIPRAGLLGLSQRWNC
jgi:hypothetical protein